MNDRENFIESMLIAALWSSTDNDDTPLDTNFGVEDFSAETLEYLRVEAGAFYDAHKEVIHCEGAPNANDGTGCAGMAGHDYWLTRNRHGSGFWDGDWPEPFATVLTNASQVQKEIYLYVGEDNKIYCD